LGILIREVKAKMLPSSIDSELFGFKGIPSFIQVDFLLPNGLFLSLEFSRNASLSELKDRLWNELEKCPLQLKSKNNYSLSTVTADAQIYEYYNLHLKLCDLNLLHWFFKIVEIQGNLEEKKFNADLSI
jgi:hypothetical protein